MDYETDRDRQAEVEVANTIAAAWKVTWHKMATQYRLDFALCDNTETVKAFLEAKRRNHAFGHYPTCYMSLRKVMAAWQLHQATDLPCFFAVQFDDVLAYVNMLDQCWPTAWRGRSDTKDPDDFEPVMLVPCDDFKIIRRNMAEAAE